MSHFRCSRCDWQSEDPAEIIAHTTGEGSHPRCVICARSLELAEKQTCVRCIGAVRADLRDIADWYALLPATLGHLGSNTPRGDGRSHSDGSERLPGGDALVMLSEGAERREGASNEGHPSDPPAVPFELWTWADDWREVRHEDQAQPLTVSELAQWLGGERCEWAARWHPAFDEFASDMARIRAALARGTGMTEQLDTTDARCLYCETTRLRKVWGKTEADDRWVCPRCHRSGTKAHYWVAVVATIRAQKGEAV